MRLVQRAFLPLLQFAAVALAASSWTFNDATVIVQGKSAGAGEGSKAQLSATSPLSTAVKLSSADTLKLALTTLDGKTGKKPHQAFLKLEDETTGLQESFALTVKDNGKAKLDLTQKQLPYQLAISEKPLKASIIIGSFGSSLPYNSPVFSLTVESSEGSSPAAPPPSERYASKPEIHHVFRDDPKSPPQIISSFFTLSVLAALPALFGGWLFLGGNIDHLGKAFGTSPISHALFFGSIVAMEGVFFMYYTSWNLFQTLPAMAIVGAVAYVSGSKALTEVQERRFAGQR